MIRLNNVSVRLNGKAVLSKVSLKINKGEFAYLVGPSGAGKTSLLRTIYMGLIPDEGTVSAGRYNSDTIKRRKIPYLRRRIGIVFQDFKLLEDRSIFDNVAFALRVTGTGTREAKIRTIKALTSVGLLTKKESMPNELSGGELQRVCIARAIVNNPVIVLADEPTGNLDPETGRDIFNLLKKINSEGTAVLTATHNYGIISEFPGRIIYIENGKLVKKDPPIPDKTSL